MFSSFAITLRREYSGVPGVVMIRAWGKEEVKERKEEVKERKEEVKERKEEVKERKDVDCQGYLWAELRHIAFYFSE